MGKKKGKGKGQQQQQAPSEAEPSTSRQSTSQEKESPEQPQSPAGSQEQPKVEQVQQQLQQLTLQQQQQQQQQQQRFPQPTWGPQQPSPGFQPQPQAWQQIQRGQLHPGYQQQQQQPQQGYPLQQQQWRPPMQQQPQQPGPQYSMAPPQQGPRGRGRGMQQPRGPPPGVGQPMQHPRGPPPGVGQPMQQPRGPSPGVPQPIPPPGFGQPGQQPPRRGPPLQQPTFPAQQGPVSPQQTPTSPPSAKPKRPKKEPGGQQLPQQDPQRQIEQAPLTPKEQSPPLGGQGDCLKQVALIEPGTKGRKIKVECNHFGLNVGNLKNAIHYDVTIQPDTPKSLLRGVMVNLGRKHYPNRHPAFDGRKNLYSPIKLPFGDTMSDTIKVEGDNGPKEFKVDIKFVRTVDLTPLHDLLKSKTSPQDALQCLDIVLRNASANNFITVGRSFFTPPTGQIISLGEGMEMYYGFYQSAIRGWKPLLNVDVAHKAFPKAIDLLELICELGSNYRYQMNIGDLNRPINRDLESTLEKFLKTIKVKYEITGQSSSKRIYRVNGLSLPASRAKFKMDDGQETTVEQYYQNIKRCRLRYPHLPTLWVGAKNRESKILLPMEFCSVVEGQPLNRKMTENQTSAMIKQAATSTDIRKKKIMDTLQKANFNNSPCIREFGFSVNSQFEVLDARILPPPNLLYANKSTVTPSKGVWRSDRNKFLIGATISKWTIASVTRSPPRCEQLADMIFRMAGPSGMQINSKAIQPFVHIGGRQTVQDCVNYFKTKTDFDLIFVVVPNSGPHYSYVKQAAELNVGCLTQCIKERTLNKLNPQTVANILLKVNSKMNGTNHCFDGPSRPLIMNRPCMIMGADVTHPSPDARDIPSVAAVTASHDPKAFKYNICWRLQPPKVEIIEDLCNITVEQLNYFYRANGCKPERIIFFRDGVSEGQFLEVQRAEIRAIKNACKRVQSQDFEPAITFLVVQKRHHTRLFPKNPRDSEDKNFNVPAGTCVDTVITNPTMQDFYLVSHASIQGVAKPTKYCTLWDDNNMSHDDIEELTYHLCHMFTRCNRSVSYPAPTYYAHLAAARAKVYIENDRLNMDELKKMQNNYQIKESICKEKPMFFV